MAAYNWSVIRDVTIAISLLPDEGSVFLSSKHTRHVPDMGGERTFALSVSLLIKKPYSAAVGFSLVI